MFRKQKGTTLKSLQQTRKTGNLHGNVLRLAAALCAQMRLGERGALASGWKAASAPGRSHRTGSLR